MPLPSPSHRPAARTSPTPRIVSAVTAVVTAAVCAVTLAACGAQPTHGALLPGGRDRRSPAGEADGVVPDGAGVLDHRYAAVRRLAPPLHDALDAAATAARRDGVRVVLTSGWRSRRYQEQLFAEAVARYGSAREAARWVARPGTSAHEAGRAVDLGPSSALSWLSRHGATYGLCPVYGNEPWHYEHRPAAVSRGCPPTYADPTADPRMRQ